MERYACLCRWSSGIIDNSEQFFVPWAREGPVSPGPLDPALGKKLWAWLEEQVAPLEWSSDSCLWIGRSVIRKQKSPICDFLRYHTNGDVNDELQWDWQLRAWMTRVSCQWSIIQCFALFCQQGKIFWSAECDRDRVSSLDTAGHLRP